MELGYNGLGERVWVNDEGPSDGYWTYDRGQPLTNFSEVAQTLRLKHNTVQPEGICNYVEIEVTGSRGYPSFDQHGTVCKIGDDGGDELVNDYQYDLFLNRLSVLEDTIDNPYVRGLTPNMTRAALGSTELYYVGTGGGIYSPLQAAWTLGSSVGVLLNVLPGPGPNWDPNIGGPDTPDLGLVDRYLPNPFKGEVSCNTPTRSWLSNFPPDILLRPPSDFAFVERGDCGLTMAEIVAGGRGSWEASMTTGEAYATLKASGLMTFTRYGPSRYAKSGSSIASEYTPTPQIAQCCSRVRFIQVVRGNNLSLSASDFLTVGSGSGDFEVLNNSWLVDDGGSGNVFYGPSKDRDWIPGKKSASHRDLPRTPDITRGYLFDAETCAVCVNGRAGGPKGARYGLDNAILGCIEWGFRAHARLGVPYIYVMRATNAYQWGKWPGVQNAVPFGAALGTIRWAGSGDSLLSPSVSPFYSTLYGIGFRAKDIFPRNR